MRHFHSYGPVDEDLHFCVPRRSLVERCAEQLIGGAGEGGHYFTIWAPRQCGKTWLMRQAKKEIERRLGDETTVATMSMQGVIMEEDDPGERFLKEIPLLFWEAFGMELPGPPADWAAFRELFTKGRGQFDRPVILFIDEFDSLPRNVIDRIVTLFRDMYLKRESYLLHGLALIGVRAVLGVESRRGSPFNIQRSLHVPTFSEDEVTELFRQYQEESGQEVTVDLVREVYRVTRGQPGLVCWFGELLTETEKYNPGLDHVIDRSVWQKAYRAALYLEWNNTILNLEKKCKAEYQPEVIELFARSDIPFAIGTEWCNYLYLNGVIDSETITEESGEEVVICRFSSPFVQERLYHALTHVLVGDRMPILSLEMLDRLTDVFEGESLNLPALLERYKGFLARLEARGLNPWKEQPRRADLRLTEAVGHFHLYAWLQAAIGRECVVSPEFPTGNGKVDLHIRYGDKRGIIEVKSFVDLRWLDKAREQAAEYAGSLGLDRVTLALFAPSKDEKTLAELSGQTLAGNVAVTVVAIGWGAE